MVKNLVNKIAIKLKYLVLNRKHGSKYIKDADQTVALVENIFRVSIEL